MQFYMMIINLSTIHGDFICELLRKLILYANDIEKSCM